MKHRNYHKLQYRPIYAVMKICACFSGSKRWLKREPIGRLGFFFLDSSLQSRRLCSEGNASFYCWDVRGLPNDVGQLGVVLGAVTWEVLYALLRNLDFVKSVFKA